jgi:hypothetical protein
MADQFKIVRHIFPALLLAVGIALGGYFVGHALSMRQLFYRYVSVKGLAEKIVKADEADWQISFSYANDSLANVYKKIAQAQTTLKDFLHKKGFADNEIEVKPVSITDNQSTGYTQNTKAKRYNGNESIIVQSNNVDLVKTTIQNIGDLVKRGVIINNTSVQYHFTKLNAIKPDMLTQATNNAEQAAKIFAKISRSKLGGIKRASQGLFTIQSARGNSYDTSSIMKKVRVVTTVEYFLR